MHQRPARNYPEGREYRIGCIADRLRLTLYGLLTPPRAPFCFTFDSSERVLALVAVTVTVVSAEAPRLCLPISAMARVPPLIERSSI